MKRSLLSLNIGVLLVVLALSAPAAAQQTARQQPRLPVMSDYEAQAYMEIGLLASAELECRKRLGRYVNFDELMKSCSAFDGITLQDPRQDKTYEFAIDMNADSFGVAAKPRQPEMAAFYSDGKRIYYNQHGAATAASTAIYDIERGAVLTTGPAPPAASAEGKSQPAAQPVKNMTIYDSCPSEAHAAADAGQATHARKVWTNEDIHTPRPAATAKPAGPPPPPPVVACVVGKDAPQHSFTAAERWSLQNQCAIDTLEMRCRFDLKRACSLEELAKGIPSQLPGEGTESMAQDLKADPDYEYRLTFVGDRYRLSVVPRHPGVGGFLVLPFPDRTHYNLNGEASKHDPEVAYQVSCIHFTKTRR